MVYTQHVTDTEVPASVRSAWPSGQLYPYKAAYTDSQIPALAGRHRGTALATQCAQLSCVMLQAFEPLFLT